MKKLVFTVLMFLCVTLTGCTNYSNFNSDKLGDSCIIASRRQMTFNNPNKVSTAIYCIDGVQYVSVEGIGLSPYINSKVVENYFENGYKSCSCEEGKE